VERETETTQAYFYDPVGAARRSAQVALYAKGLRSDDEPAAKPHLKIRGERRLKTFLNGSRSVARQAVMLRSHPG
jgi:hypothetical protein